MTDEERLEIARELRHRAFIWQTAYDYGACPEPYSAGLMRILRDEVTDAIGIDRLSPPDRILERLAELTGRFICEELPGSPGNRMATDYDRRELARDIRRLAEGWDVVNDGFTYTVHETDWAMRDLLDLLGINDGNSFTDACYRLADLIEPARITGKTSDGYHTFDELYHRAVLFSVIVSMFPDLSWKSRLHADGTMYDGMFIVGIYTPAGPATYHCDIEPYWDMFPCKTLDRAPEWDGHTPDDAIARIATLRAGILRGCRKGDAVRGLAGRLPHLPLGEQNMKCAMISQPMAGKTNEEIVEDRERAATALRAMGYEVLNTYFTADWPGEEAMMERGAQVPLCYLAKSLELMSLCHAVYFVKGWEDARGCKIEHEAAEAYGLEVIHE